ncbi:MAG TPA: M4 family metallopeptidase, partial [Saprospiraceae bacterium]|nr:M4 family metallopeptidase [Saprospiraceae bacterium]
MITRLFLIHRAALIIIALSAFVISKAQKLPEKNVDAAAFNFPHLEKSTVSPDLSSNHSFHPRSISLPDRVIPEQYYHTRRLAFNGFPSELKLFYPYHKGHEEKAAQELTEKIQTDFGHGNTELFTWRVEKVVEDELNARHLFLREYYAEIPIYNNEAVLHGKDQHFYHFNAQWERVGDNVGSEPRLSEQQAFQKIKQWFLKEEAVSFQRTKWVPEEANEGQLWIYVMGDKAHLVWKFSYMPDPMHRWEVFLDAVDGRMVDYYQNLCSAHRHLACEVHVSEEELTPPSITSGVDLNGINRDLNTFQISGVHYMIDASKNMFNAQASSLPNDPTGAIWTIDANGGFPGNGNWSPQQFASNSRTWNNPSAVSAHFNAGRAYDYFEQVFGRNSINGRGGNVLSFVDVRNENGSEMDNAFWNGVAIFYGNGNFAFRKPLASALDVAGHEMSHGVIQNTTNLEYRNESGALNESFADVFGVMIDRDDWLLGEEVVNPSVFRGGALRSMEDPHNGGTSLNDPGYQPRHYDERFTGSDDNGGVHINSGIPNFAFFKIATDL